ncbi:2'-5' RNA ligase family protein [Bacteroidota bacterium]
MKEKKSLYFIAILPPESVQNEVTELKNYFLRKYEVRQALKSPPHITLHPPFNWPDNNEDKLKESLFKFAAKNVKFNITLNGFGAFKPRVIYIDVLRSQNLEILFEKIEYFLETTWEIDNQLRKGRKFNPHMTIAFRDLTKEQFFQSWPEFKDKQYHRDFMAADISLLRHNGKFWDIIAYAPLNNVPEHTS